MTITELNKDQLSEVTKLYIENKQGLPKETTIEEFVEYYVKKCESCGKFVISEEELLIGTNWKGQKYHVCDLCYEDSEEYCEKQKSLYEYDQEFANQFNNWMNE